MSKQVQMDVVLPQSPERVWRALTDAKALAQWLLPNDFQPRVGHGFRFTPRRRRQEKGSVIQCEVIELDAPRRLVYSWRENARETPDLVTWTLEPVEAGTRVRLEHTRLTDLTACTSVPGLPGRQTVRMAIPIARLERMLTRGRRRRLRGRITLSSGGAFGCVAISPSVLRFEEVLK